MSFAEGACLGIPALTAHRALTVDGALDGPNVLVAGGAGAVGQYAIQMAKLLGAAQVIATVSSDEKAERARAAGADAVVDYRRESVARARARHDRRARRRSCRRGRHRRQRALVPQIVAKDGLCVAYGSNAPQATFDFGPMILSGAAVRFFIVYELSAEARARGVADVNRWLAEGRLRHAIGATSACTHGRGARARRAGASVIGNVIVEP